MLSLKEKWKDMPIIGKIGLIIAIIVPMGLMVAGLVTIIIKLGRSNK